MNYTYTKAIALDRLESEVKAAIAQQPSSIYFEGESVVIVYTSDLSAAEITTLNSVVAAHIATPIAPDIYYTTSADKAKLEAVQGQLDLKASTANLNATAFTLQTAIDTKANTTTLNSSVTTLQTAIDLKASQTSLDTAVTTLNQAIDLKAPTTALNSAVSTLNTSIGTKANTTDVNTSVTTLQTSIDTKASTTALNSAVSTLNTSIATKYDASNPSAFETPAQLNTRDVANRARGNHSGTQLANTISNFASTVLSTVLTGLSVATGTPVVATDSILTALGKIQAVLDMRAILTSPIATGIANVIGTSTAFARADHTHNTFLTRFRLRQTATFSTTATAYTVIPTFTLTPTVAGTYYVAASVVLGNSNNGRTVGASIFKTGVKVADSESGGVVTGGRPWPYFLDTIVEVNGTTDTIDVRVTSDGNTTTVDNRTITLIRIG